MENSTIPDAADVIDLTLFASEKHPKLQVWSAGHLDVTVPHRLAVFSEKSPAPPPTVSTVHPPHTYNVSFASKTKTSNVANDLSRPGSVSRCQASLRTGRQSRTFASCVPEPNMCWSSDTIAKIQPETVLNGERSTSASAR